MSGLDAARLDNEFRNAPVDNFHSYQQGIVLL